MFEAVADIAQPIAPRVRFQPLALLQIGFCALFMTVSMPLIEHPHLHLTPRIGVALAVTAFLGTATAFSIQSWGNCQAVDGKGVWVN